MTAGLVASPLANAPDVACRYIGAHTLHTWEKRDAWA